jgi:hypothetical protein
MELVSQGAIWVPFSIALMALVKTVLQIVNSVLSMLLTALLVGVTLNSNS